MTTPKQQHQDRNDIRAWLAWNGVHNVSIALADALIDLFRNLEKETNGPY